MAKNKFADVYKEFLIFKKRKLKPQSYSTLCYNFNANILDFFSNYNIEDIKATDILNWQEKILEKNFSNNHNKNLFSMLKDFFTYCIKYYNFNEEIILDIPQFKIKLEKKKYDYYTIKEFKKFIKFLDNNIYKQFFNLMYFTGTRPGEAMALKFSDLSKGYISINKTIDEHGKRNLGTPKTLSSNRDIAIDRKLEKDLHKLKTFYIKKYSDYTMDYFIFGGIKPLSPTTINRYKLNACKKANLRPITLHQFRHSHATMLKDRGIDIHVISKRLGHSKVSTTLNVYTHANLKQEKRVVNTLNSLRFNFLEGATCFLKKLISILKH